MTVVSEEMISTTTWTHSYPAGVAWDMELRKAPLWTLLDEAVVRFADRPAIDFLDRRYSYRQVREQVDRFAAGLQRMGLRPGDRVGLFLPNCPYFIFAYFGVLKAGGTVVNINPLYAAREIEHLVRDSGIRFAVTLDLKALLPKLQPLLTDSPLERIIVCSMAASLPFPKNFLFPIAKKADVAEVPADGRHSLYKSVLGNAADLKPITVDPVSDIAVLQYTGGTTGVPKGAMLTHANLYANAQQAAAWFVTARPGEERMLAVLPFFHVFAMTAAMNLAILMGAEIVMLPRFELDQVMQTIDKKKPTLFPAVPTIYTAINNHRHRTNYDLTSIRLCISGGAPLPLDVKRTFETNTGCKLVEGYGLSESSPVAACNPLDGGTKSGSIGLPVPGTRIDIISLEDGSTPVALGERGEVCIRGPQVMKGYWNKPEETRTTLRDGRLHTGDVGYMDAEGYVYIVDRIKDMILCSGYNVYPRNVEEAIYLHPDVAEVVVGGVDDTYRGQTVKAWIKLKEGRSLDRDGLITFLHDKLSPIEMPKHVEFRPDLPKTLVGKLDRKTLLVQEAARASAAAAGQEGKGSAAG